MTQYLIKIAVSVGLVVAVSEVSKRSTMFGALLASIPVVSVLAMAWMHVETGDDGKVADLSLDIFWLVIPSLALFLVLPPLEGDVNARTAARAAAEPLPVEAL